MPINDYDFYSYSDDVLSPDFKSIQLLKKSPYETIDLYNEKPDKPTENAYLDRMKEWNPDAYRNAELAVFDGRYLSRAAGKTVQEINKFLSVYNGYPCKLVTASENMGYNGYYYTYLEWERAE